MISVGHRVLMNFELRQLWLSLLPFSTLIIIKMMIDLSDHETIKKKTSTCAWIKRMDIVSSFQLAKQDFSGCDFKVLVYLWFFLCFSELTIPFFFFVIGYKRWLEGVRGVSSWVSAVWQCKVRLSRMISSLYRTSPLIGKRSSAHFQSRACGDPFV